jgi:hypothetical protein
LSPAGRARLLSLGVLGLIFGVQLSGHVFHQLNRTLRGPDLAEVRTVPVPGRILDVDLGPDRKVTLPSAWLGRRGDRPDPPASLLVFVDGRPVHHFAGDPGGTTRDPYAYSRTRRSTALFVRCPEDRACAQATVVLADVRFSAALTASRLRRFPGHAWALVVGIALWIATAAWATRLWSAAAAWRAAAAALLALSGWLALGLQATAWSLPILVVEAAALAVALFLRLARMSATWLRSRWAVAASPRQDARAQLARALFVAGLCAIVAAPYVWTGLSWYPADRDDSFLYLRGASRLLADGSLLHGAINPDAWVYSIYPLVLAALSRLAGVHPMVAYKWLGYAGAALLPAAMGLFAYAVSRSLRTALLACWIAGLWGGLAGYVWLAREGVPALIEHRAPPLLNDDYFEPRFLGEYAGPHSEITAYVCRVPLYPREAGLLLFWPALGLAYAGLPRPSTRRLLVVALLIVACTALYPYYGIPGLLALAGICLATAWRERARGSRAAWPLLAIAVGAGLAILGLADLMVRLHKSPAGLLPYLAELWRRPPEEFAPAAPVRFTLPRVLGGHFFMAAAVAAAWAVRAGRGREWSREARAVLKQWPGWALFLPSLALAAAAGILARFELPGRFLDPYGWIVPWRTLVEPVIVLATAVSVGILADHLRRARRFYLAAPLLLLPVVSPLHWTFNADRYLREAALRPYGRGRNQALYDEYSRLGTALLGRLRLREPVLVEARYVGPLEAALGVRAVGAVAQYEPLIVYSEYAEMRDLLDRKRAAGEIGDLAALRGGAFERRLALSRASVPLTRLGPYTILRWTPPPSAP